MLIYDGSREGTTIGINSLFSVSSTDNIQVGNFTPDSTDSASWHVGSPYSTNVFTDWWDSFGSSSRRRITDEDEDEPEGPLMNLPLDEFRALCQRLDEEYQEAERTRIERGLRYIEADDRERTEANAEYWSQHRRENPSCVCERCRLHRGEVTEEEEDILGW